MDILVVEDDDNLRYLLAEIITELGFKCDLANNGKIAFELNIKNKYDLIVTDMKMPVMDGKELILKIRSHEKGKPVPIIIISGHTEIKDLLGLGVTYFLNKPFEESEIIEFINKSLGIAC
ncbi:MAG: response regulator [Planctomycetota bacterium]|nr:MAG: response regulator [Planctomycetota bacterium]